MNIPPEVLNAHQLFLRDDLEEEIGVLDLFRRPLSNEEWAAEVLRAKERGKWMPSYEDHCRVRANASFPTLFSIYAGIPSGKTAPDPVFADRYARYHVDFDGLFYDATLRINAAMGLPIDGPCPIVAAKRRVGTQLSLPVRPTHFLLHNRLKHTFHVVPWVYLREALSPIAQAE